jgi:type IV pilus assembly protein PilF
MGCEVLGMRQITVSLIVFCILLSGCVSSNTENVNAIDLKHAAQVNSGLGLAYLQEGQIERAKEKLLLAQQQDPDAWSVLLSYGYFLLSVDDISGASVYYKRALELYPKKGEVLSNYGVFLCKTGRYKLAIKYLLKAAHTFNYTKVGEAYKNAALCAAKIPDKNQAKAYMQEALKYRNAPP